MRRIVTCLAIVSALLGGGQGLVAQDKAGSKKQSAKIIITLPEQSQQHKPTKLKIEGVENKQKGSEREIVTPELDPGTYKYTIEALIEPNNYTKITRIKEVFFKPGETVKVDMRIKDPKTDKIVVRWVPTPDDIVDKMSELAKITKDDVVYDLGCGDAVMLIRPIQKLGAKKGVGIDIDPKMIAKAKVKAKEAGVADRVELKVGDILNLENLPDCSVVMLYIGDDLGERLGPVLKKVLRPGARIVSHRFGLGDWKPEQTITVKGEDGDEYTLHLWIVKGKE